MRVCVVTTTINTPTFLGDYVKNQQCYGHTDVKYIVVGDLKTPSAAREYCSSLPSVLYMGASEQGDYLRKYPELAKHLPWNDIARRNIGHLWAYEEEGAEVLIMLDDDNLATDDDFIQHHSAVGSGKGLGTYMPTFESSTKWLNPCVVLKEEFNRTFYPRGFAPKHRWEETKITPRESIPVAVNAGLWLGDPDVDAITRLEYPAKVFGYKLEFYENITLHPGTWCPWNCQNTAIARRVIPAYFLSPYCGRHLDIWASYVVSRIAGHLYEGVNFGRPLANHQRTIHNLYRDLEAELPWIEKTDDFCDKLRNMVLLEGTYKKCLEEVASQPLAHLQYMEGLEIWGEAFSRLGD